MVTTGRLGAGLVGSVGQSGQPAMIQVWIAWRNRTGYSKAVAVRPMSEGMSEERSDERSEGVIGQAARDCCRVAQI